MRKHRFLAGVLIFAAGLVGAGPAQGADLRPSDALAIASDVAGAQQRSASVASWTKLLKAPKGTPAAAQLVTATGPPAVLVVSRALVARDTKTAKKLANAATKLPGAKLDALDASALGVGVPALGGAHRGTWRDGRVVAQLTVVDPGAALGTDGLATVTALVRARVKTRSALPAWDALMNDAGASAKPPGVTTALQAFALTFGSVPGVHAPGGPAGDASATLALEWVVRVAGKLTHRQLAAVGKRIHNVLGSPKVRASASGPSVRQQSEDLKTARNAIAFHAARMGLTGDLPDVVIDYRPGTADGVEAFTVPYSGDLPRLLRQKVFPGIPEVNACTLVLLSSAGNTPGGQERSGADRRYIIAHEAFHCLMQHKVVGVLTTALARPWIGEGGAVWAGCQFAPDATYAGGPYTWAQQWIGQPDHSLLEGKGYEGVGFLNLLKDHGVDPWSRMASIFRAKWDAHAAFDNAVGDQRQAVLDGWASTYLDDASRGADWAPQQSTCSKPPAVKRQPHRIFVFPGQTVTETVAPWTSTIDAIAGNAELVRVHTEKGTARISSRTGIDDKNVQDERYCISASKCTCAGAGVKQLYTQDEEPLAALTGGPDGATVTFTAEASTCPVITSASFSVPSATFNGTHGSLSFTSSENWDVGWGSTSMPPTLPLKAGSSQFAGAVTMKGGGSYHSDYNGTSCDGTLQLVTADSPNDALITVESDSGSGANRTWTLRLRATDYGSFFSRDDCVAPDFGNTDLNYNNHLWEAHVTLQATGSQTEHTQEFAVASDPSHAEHENWTGTVKVTGIW